MKHRQIRSSAFSPLMKTTLAGALALAASAFAHPAHAMNINVEGGLDIDSPSISSTQVPDLHSSSGTTGTVGAFVDFDLIQGLAIETGLQYLPRKFSTSSVSQNFNLTGTQKYWMIPLLLRYTGLPIFNVGVGPYFAKGAGVINITGTSGGSAVNETQTFPQATTSPSDWGFLGSVQAVFPVAPGFHVLADVRYLLGVEDVDTSGQSPQKYRDWQFLVGVGLSI